MVFANRARSYMQQSLSVLDQTTLTSNNFFIGNMIPTCISDDIEAAKSVNRRTLTSYAMLPNYRNYWKGAGNLDLIPDALSDRWLADTTLFGTPSQVRDGIEAWFDSGIKCPIIVPSAIQGGQFQAFEEFFSIWD